MSFKQLKRITAVCVCASSLLTVNTASAEGGSKIGSLNGETITQEQVLAYARAAAPTANLQDEKVQKQVLNNYIGRELLYQAAVGKKLDQIPAVQQAIEEQRRALLAQALVEQLTQANPITEKDLRAFYDSEAKKRPDAKIAEYEKIRPQLAAVLQDRLVNAYVMKLKEQAKLQFDK